MSVATDRIQAALADLLAHEHTERRDEMLDRIRDAVNASRTTGVVCSCRQHERGLWCTDGRCAELLAGDDACKLCGLRAWQHWTDKP